MFDYSFIKAFCTIKRDQAHSILRLFVCSCCTCCRKNRKLSKDERIYKQGIKKLYTEIDLLEVVKQLRISRFMSSVILSANQRELVKFMKPYVLYTKSMKRHSRSIRLESDNNLFSIADRLHPAEEALLDFKPDENEIDGKLYEGIVEIDEQAVRERRSGEDSENGDQSSGESDDSSEDEGFEIGGRRGFNTNMDDFLKNFGSVSGRGSDKSLRPGRALSSQIDPPQRNFT